jgi:hypothetical protein
LIRYNLKLSRFAGIAIDFNPCFSNNQESSFFTKRL